MMLYYLVLYSLLSGFFVLAVAVPSLFPALSQNLLGPYFAGFLFLFFQQYLLDLKFLPIRNRQHLFLRSAMAGALMALLLPHGAMMATGLMISVFLCSLGLKFFVGFLPGRWSVMDHAPQVLASALVLLAMLNPQPELVAPQVLVVCAAVTLASIVRYWVAGSHHLLSGSLILFVFAQMMGPVLPAPWTAFLSIPFASLLVQTVFLASLREMRSMDTNGGRWTWISVMPVFSVALGVCVVVPGLQETLPAFMPNMSLLVLLLLPLGLAMFESIQWRDLGISAACYTVGTLCLLGILLNLSGVGFSLTNMHAYGFFENGVSYVMAGFSWLIAAIVTRVWLPLINALPD